MVLPSIRQEEENFLHFPMKNRFPNPEALNKIKLSGKPEFTVA
jgi:hypothetical protein